MSYNRKQRLNDNIKAIETAFILDREQRTPTARERLLLERYCGFGGLKCILNPARELADAVHWAKSDLELFAPTVELHRLIRENSKNESEYKQLMDSLKQSVLTAFYTPSAITEALADVLKEHQIIPEKVLEPSAGIGAFVDSVLDNNPKADIMAFEKDLLTGKILCHLHPEQKVRIEGFEKIEKPFNDYFDLAISNIPFGDVAVFDPSYTAMKGMRALVTRRIHNYFFVKALDTVRDGGLVAFITSQGVLNAKNNSAARFMMLYHADLVSAIRLPNNLFTENANTEVGSDLIILQKNTQKESLRGDDNLLDTVYNDENRIPTNNYFLEHPERIIHTTAKLDTDPFGKPAMIYTHEDGVEGIAEDLRKMLHEDFKKKLNLNRYLGIEETKAEEVKEVEETEKIEKTEKMKPSIEEKQNDTVVSLQKQEKPTDDAELSQKSNHQQPPVQMTLFDLWGMEEENRQAVHSTKKKAEVTVGAAAKKVSRKKASPLVKSVNPTFEVVTKPVEKEEKPSLTDAKEQETTQETKPILPGDEPYASISWEENPPINGFYEMMMTMAPEDRVLLRQKAELHRQEQLKALGVEDTLDPKFKPPIRAYGLNHPRRMTLALVTNLLGGPGMSARLNLSLRERHALVYTVESFFITYSDTGVWGVYFGCDPHDVSRCRRLVRRELDRLMAAPLTSAQLRAAKQQMKGQVAVASDGHESYALDMAKLFLHQGKLKNVQRVLDAIDAITAADVQAVAQDLFAPEALTEVVWH